MTMPVPTEPKIYHIVHFDLLQSIIADKFLWCDAKISQRHDSGTSHDSGTIIGMGDIKQRRLNELTLASHPDLYVGSCVPFYFCPRSVMLYVIRQGNHTELKYRGGQNPIIHLEADLYRTVDWADKHNQRWAFTLSNAGSNYFEDRCDLAQLNKINWNVVQARSWKQHIEAKQAEFLLENRFPWHLVERIGVYSRTIYQQATNVLPTDGHRPKVEIKEAWYY